MVDKAFWPLFQWGSMKAWSNYDCLVTGPAFVNHLVQNLLRRLARNEIGMTTSTPEASLVLKTSQKVGHGPCTIVFIPLCLPRRVLTAMLSSNLPSQFPKKSAQESNLMLDMASTILPLIYVALSHSPFYDFIYHQKSNVNVEVFSKGKENIQHQQGSLTNNSIIFLIHS